MSRRGHRNDPVAFWIDIARSAAATAVTLSVRVPQLVAGRMSAAERRRMVSEKFAAAGEGVLKGGATMAKVMMRRAAKPNPMTAMVDLTEILDAATRPTRRRVKANAKRLTKA